MAIKYVYTAKVISALLFLLGLSVLETHGEDGAKPVNDQDWIEKVKIGHEIRPVISVFFFRFSLDTWSPEDKTSMAELMSDDGRTQLFSTKDVWTLTPEATAALHAQWWKLDKLKGYGRVPGESYFILYTESYTPDKLLARVSVSHWYDGVGTGGEFEAGAYYRRYREVEFDVGRATQTETWKVKSLRIRVDKPLPYSRQVWFFWLFNLLFPVFTLVLVACYMAIFGLGSLGNVGCFGRLAILAVAGGVLLVSYSFFVGDLLLLIMLGLFIAYLGSVAANEKSSGRWVARICLLLISLAIAGDLAYLFFNSPWYVAMALLLQLLVNLSLLFYSGRWVAILIAISPLIGCLPAYKAGIAYEKSAVVGAATALGLFLAGLIYAARQRRRRVYVRIRIR